MIGVIFNRDQARVAEEFFQLFKTPWEPHRTDEVYDVVIAMNGEVPSVEATLTIVYGSGRKTEGLTSTVTAGHQPRGVMVRFGGIEFPVYGEVNTFEADSERALCRTADGEIVAVQTDAECGQLIRIGYDLFAETAFLLEAGQPVANAGFPTLDLHISMLRTLILAAGIPVLEIPPAPAGRDFVVCLTHDIDFVGIRRHKFDHTLWGFLYRSLVVAPRDFLRKRMTFGRLCETVGAVISLPLVYLGWKEDFWVLFDWYLKVEKNLSPTYFFIPFKDRSGERVTARHAARRASAYEIGDIPEWISRLLAERCEIGVHGIDAWHSVERGREELERVTEVTGKAAAGIRIHWLLRDSNTARVLEEAGYAYDSTSGYNEAPGYFSGTAQVFRPAGVETLLELPLHIQDGALFFANRLGLSDAEAWERCEAFVRHVRERGGVLVVLWHDRSPGPERFWGDFYIRLVDRLKELNPWFGTAGQVVAWFSQRRAVTFERMPARDGSGRIRICGRTRAVSPPLNVRLYRPHKAGRSEAAIVDFPWDGQANFDVEPRGEIPVSGAEEVPVGSRPN